MCDVFWYDSQEAKCNDYNRNNRNQWPLRSFDFAISLLVVFFQLSGPTWRAPEFSHPIASLSLCVIIHLPNGVCSAGRGLGRQGDCFVLNMRHCLNRIQSASSAITERGSKRWPSFCYLASVLLPEARLLLNAAALLEAAKWKNCKLSLFYGRFSV